jgi:hypothetical protein
LSERDVFWPPGTLFPPTLGAGLWFLKEDLLRVLEETPMETLLPDRTGSVMLSGGDIELGHLFSRAGMICAYGSKLRIEHVIPATRLETRYFIRLIIGIIRSQETLDCKYDKQSIFFGRTTSTVDLALAILAIPFLLLRRDPIREVLFVLAARWAKVLGPYEYA